ncbi:Histone acetyltransferase HPA2-like protein [Ignavibacterium album JCM 16511]|uniref:Histone acetyltransferase HPA2-like protein n=1 Tax=Ignavibacterium album (strain DSM 19864 / JCM 16511 / NBRC 101810 / Mat9-16) TaxID=945713 RepID=I0ANL2_IGNAJ|nr:GNAT family N-acetyltransferase [Ignavibacterium album]AFH50569.1 Histone acetyltransferase HPA2-like protein [Ignavibacterium album JCM 16511]
MIIKSPQTRQEFFDYYDLRWRILRAPWNQPKGSEQDELEGQAIHIIAVEESKVVGCGRVHFNSDEEAQIRYMAVENHWQGKGIGNMILAELEKKIIEKGAKKIILHARENVVKFYQNNGYQVVKPSHTLFGAIPHYLMEKKV